MEHETCFEAIAAALRDAGVRYLVVNAHGYLRLTYDADLVVQLTPDNIQLAFKALASLGYRPTVPVTADQFADEAQRARYAPSVTPHPAAPAAAG